MIAALLSSGLIHRVFMATHQIMSTLSKIYKTDTTKEVEGVRIEMPANDDGTVPYFVLARAGGKSNQRYQKALERNMRPVKAELRLKTLDNKRADELLMASFVEGSLLSWGNVPKADVTGVETDEGYCEYSQENAKQLMTRLPELYADLQERAADLSYFREGVDEESAKN